MQDRTAAVVITIFVVVLFGCPGLAFLCFGLTDFVDFYTLNSYIYGIHNANFANGLGVAGLCAGIFFIAIAVVVAILVLRRKRPIPPATPSEPIPPPS